MGEQLTYSRRTHLDMDLGRASAPPGGRAAHLNAGGVCILYCFLLVRCMSAVYWRKHDNGDDDDDTQAHLSDGP